MSCRLTLKDLSCSRNGKQLFRKVSLNIGHKDKVAILGANGAGKTTLLKSIVGLSPVTEGSIEVFHNPLVTDADFRDARKRIGYLFQDPDDMLFCPTVIEEVAFGMLSRGETTDSAVAKAERMLKYLGIEHLRNRVSLKLSGGEKKLVALAAVLVTSPDILLLDEPSSALDTETEAHIAQILRNLDMSMLIVSHNLEFVRSVATDVYSLEQNGLVHTIFATGADLFLR